ncbi:hypothetical protein [Halodesulfurarchaeum sp.]|uniref:hypothetical protein n=1 Tax=Halodesulfurarchaeum sp. TaxID=1980530 RepID=UPI002FC2FD91
MLELAAAVRQTGFDKTVSDRKLQVLTCLVPAFFIGGGISRVVSSRIVLNSRRSEAKRTPISGLASIATMA